jgi:hypothetical protein
MRQRRWILLPMLLVCAIITSWLWWVRPKKVDMTTYAPADSLLYIEANQPLDVADTIAGTEAWRAFEKTIGEPTIAPRSRWLRGFIRWTGIGPIQSVILARAQIAAVVTDLGVIEEGETLRIKQEEAILIETHTSEGRIKAPFEQAIKTLAEKNYGRPTVRRTTLDGIEFVEWSAPEGARQIVGTIIGSLVIVGNTERVVQNCLAVSQGRRQSLKGDLELARMRLRLGGDNALAFGYVPTGNSARLLGIGLPMLLGRSPGDSGFQRLITNGATKVFGSLGWTSRSYLTGIEDQYLISLQPSIVARLRPYFNRSDINSEMQHLVPDGFYSVSSYKFANPAAAWQSLKSAVSSEVDAFSTIVFSSLLKSSILSYGIDDPDSFLRALNGELLTVRLDENAQRSILIAHVLDRATLQQLLMKKMVPHPRNDYVEKGETFEDPQGEFAASFINDFIVLGTAVDVHRYAAGRLANTNTELNGKRFRQMTFFASSNTSANIVTYTDDTDRVRSFVLAMIAVRDTHVVASARIEEGIARLPFSVTETTLGDQGIERITRSPLGQLSTVLPLLVPEKSSPGTTLPEAK